jgi:hypothetical protein
MFYRGEPHLLNLELQTGADSDMPGRMVRYHSELHTQSGLPVISMIPYPFETTVPIPPYVEWSGNRRMMVVEYQVLTVWKWDAREFVRDHVVCLYTLLPAMKGVSAALLMLVEVVEARFPALVPGAKVRAEITSDAAELHRLVVEIVKASDEAAARRLLIEYGRE